MLQRTATATRHRYGLTPKGFTGCCSHFQRDEQIEEMYFSIRGGKYASQALRYRGSTTVIMMMKRRKQYRNIHAYLLVIILSSRTVFTEWLSLVNAFTTAQVRYSNETNGLLIVIRLLRRPFRIYCADFFVPRD